MCICVRVHVCMRRFLLHRMCFVCILFFCALWVCTYSSIHSRAVFSVCVFITIYLFIVCCLDGWLQLFPCSLAALFRSILFYISIVFYLKATERRRVWSGSNVSFRVSEQRRRKRKGKEAKKVACILVKRDIRRGFGLSGSSSDTHTLRHKYKHACTYVQKEDRQFGSSWLRPVWTTPDVGEIQLIIINPRCGDCGAQ